MPDVPYYSIFPASYEKTTSMSIRRNCRIASHSKYPFGSLGTQTTFSAAAGENVKVAVGPIWSCNYRYYDIVFIYFLTGISLPHERTQTENKGNEW